MVSFVDDHQVGGRQFDLSGSHCAGMQSLDRGDLSPLAGSAWEIGLNDAVFYAELEQIPGRLLDQLSAMGQEESPLIV
jgi:hypothetical protein